MLVKYKQTLPAKELRLEPCRPLWQIVPTRDEDGRPLCDFMMFIPGLRKKSALHIESVFRHIQAVLEHYQEVVFANVNLPINVLWVSLKHRPGLILEIAAAIKLLVPEAVLVAQKPQY